MQIIPLVLRVNRIFAGINRGAEAAIQLFRSIAAKSILIHPKSSIIRIDCAMSIRILSLLVGLFALITVRPLRAQDRPSSIFEQLTQKEMNRLTLEVDLTTLLAGRKTNKYFPARLSLEKGGSWEVEVKPRGRYRRKVCEMPPLKIKFKKKALQAQGLDTLNEIKLTIPCHQDEQGNELVVKEYLAYRMFEQLTPVAVRARLVRLTLVDTHIGKEIQMTALLLEDEEETAKRFHGQLIEEYGLPVDSLLVNQAALVTVFQYMIGNTDWDINMIRNVRTIRSMEGGKVIVIPYDFDFSGLVNAPYATPSSESGLRNVRERFLVNTGLSPEALRRAALRIKSSKPALMALCKSKYLSADSTTDLQEYLESFFGQIGSFLEPAPNSRPLSAD